jgi:hypothetical protein
MTFGEDLNQRGYRESAKFYQRESYPFTHAEFISIYALQLYCDRASSGLKVVHITGPMGGQVCLPILEAWYLEFPVYVHD